MPRTIITHVGASLLREECGAFSRFSDREDLIRNLKYNQGVAYYHNRAAAHLARELDRHWGEQTERHMRDSPAEIASLSLMAPKLGPDDRIVLLHSDTGEGAFCAEVLRRVLKRELSDIREARGSYPFSAAVEVQRIEGLRVTDEPGAQSDDDEELEDSFVRRGLASYVEHVWAAYQELYERSKEHKDADFPQDKALIFNVTAGYKGMVPIARDLALLLHTHSQRLKRRVTTSLCYLYETSTKLITFESLPVQFDWRRVTLSQLRRAAAEDEVEPPDSAKRVRWENLAPEEQRYFRPIPGDVDHTYACLSPLGRVVWELGKRIDATAGRPQDDYAELKPVGRDEIKLAGSDPRRVRLANPWPDAPWELRNEHGQRIDLIEVFSVMLSRESYDERDEKPVVEALQEQPPHLQSLWRYSGALIEHLYLRRDSLAYTERAARLCRALIAYFTQKGGPDADAALPALWRSYRDALSVMVAAHKDLNARLDSRDDQGDQSRTYEALRSEQENLWLNGWAEQLDTLHRQAQRMVVGAMTFRNVELRIQAPAFGELDYPLELHVEGDKPHGGSLELDRETLDKSNNPHEYGRQLGKLLFANKALEEAYRHLWRECQDRGEYLQVRLRVKPPELRTIAWERIYHPWLGGWQPLGTTQATPFARLVAGSSAERASRADELDPGRLRALVVIASPSDLSLPQITHEEREEYRKLFAQLPDLKAEFLEGETKRPTLANLRQEILKGYEIVHFICHGVLGVSEGIEPSPDEYVLWLEDDAGAGARATAKEILATIGDTKSPPKLCFLAACQSGEHRGHEAFIPLGEALVRQGRAERAVAMNGTIGIETARQFTETFYRQLVAHRVIDLAMNEARGIVRDSWDFGAPILFLG